MIQNILELRHDLQTLDHQTEKAVKDCQRQLAEHKKVVINMIVYFQDEMRQKNEKIRNSFEQKLSQLQKSIETARPANADESPNG